MIEVVYCMRRKDGITHAQFLAHWEGVHVPIVMRNLGALCLARYERIVPLQHAYSSRVERLHHMAAPFDGVARLCWADDALMRQAFESEAALAVQRELAADEANFVDSAASSRWVAQSLVHV